MNETGQNLEWNSHYKLVLFVAMCMNLPATCTHTHSMGSKKMSQCQSG